MRLAALDGAAGGDERLADDLAAEDPLPADLRAVAAEQVDLEPLEIEDLKEVVDGAGHAEGLRERWRAHVDGRSRRRQGSAAALAPRGAAIGWRRRSESRRKAATRIAQSEAPMRSTARTS